MFLGFIDLRKAFDRIWRQDLFTVLEEKGLGGKFLTIVKGLYQGHRRKVQVGDQLTDWINCGNRVRQGCVLSPILFTIYIADLSARLQEARGVSMCNASIPTIWS